MVRCACLILFLLFSQTGKEPPSVREVLAVAGNSYPDRYPVDLLNTKLADDLMKGHYFHLGYHINPSAEGLLIFSRDRKFMRELFGWELATLPDGSIVYHHSETHFAPTHSLEISVFNPSTQQDWQIYPPKPYQPVRREFIGGVAKVYEERGADWFRNHNHHMNPELFNSFLAGEVGVDKANSIAFAVRFGDPENGNDPLPFTAEVSVRCAPIDRIEQLQCSERAQ